AGVNVHYVNARVASLYQWLVIPQVLGRLKPDLYHYPFFDMPYIRPPSVVTIYDLNPMLNADYFDHFAKVKGAAARALFRSTLRRSRAALAISEATRNLVGKHYPESASKVRTIHLGVDLNAWAREASDGSPTPATGDSEAPWRSRGYVLYVGVDRPHKNLLRLVRSFGRFRVTKGWERGSGAYLWLAGVGVGSPELRAQIADMGLGRDVRLHSELDEVALRAAYNGAVAVAYVSTSEGFGLPLLEALAAGV